MARITRKELKTDKFALELEQTFTFFEEHRRDIIRYGAIAAVVIVLVLGFRIYQRSQHTNREQALARAILVRNTPVGPITPGGAPSFPTQQLKDEAITKAFENVKAKYSGSDEAYVAEYYLAVAHADQGNLAQAEKEFLEVAQKGGDRYGSLANLSLAQVYFAQGKVDQGQKVLEDLIAHPTIFVSKDQASLALARGLLTAKPAEARKILDKLRAQQGSAGEVASSMYSELPPQ